MTKKFNLDDYKKTIKSSDTPLKDNKYIELNDALKEVIGLPGVPLGHITQIYGLSDSGKTSLLFHSAAQAQKQGVLPVLIITEGKIDWSRAQKMGFDKSNAIINDECIFLEDIFEFTDKILADQASGKLASDLMICVDSIGNSISRDSVKINKDGTMETQDPIAKAARVLRGKMRIYSHRINDTRKVSYPFNAGLMFINHAYNVPPKFPGAPPSIAPYGGDAIWLASSLVLRTKAGKDLVATKEGRKYKFGLVSKIAVDKNHISTSTNSGEFIVTEDSILPNEEGAIEEYKEANKESWGEINEKE